MSKTILEQEHDPLLTSKQFAHLPTYSDPTTGLLARWPSKWIPYGQLMRLDRPGGFYAFYFPYIIGLAYAACITPTPVPVEHLFTIAVKLLPFNVLLRGAACTWNDIVDRDFDRRVERCRHRPIARGAVSASQGLAFTVVQLFALYGLLLTFPDVCKVHTAIATILLFVYALMKRVTYYPQVVLGFPFAWAIFITLGALEVDPLNRTHLLATIALFTANVLWTIIYDTIYAHQDVEDDEKAGVKGMALRFRHTTKLLAACLTIVQLIMLALCGFYAALGFLYFIGTVGGVAVAMTYFIYDVDLARPESCGRWFHDQFWLVGAGFMLGFALEYITRQL